MLLAAFPMLHPRPLWTLVLSHHVLLGLLRLVVGVVVVVVADGGRWLHSKLQFLESCMSVHLARREPILMMAHLLDNSHDPGPSHSVQARL